MGVVFYQVVSVFSIVASVLWFNVLIVFGLLMRTLKRPIRFSAFPLLLIIILSIFRVFAVITVPGAVVISSNVVYPAIINVLRHELAFIPVLGLSVNAAIILLCTWIVVAVWRVSAYFYGYITRMSSIMNMYGNCERDHHAESVLADAIGHDKNFRVFRSSVVHTAIALAFKPYIILPVIEFTHEELRPVLLHEWKHIQDRDYLTGIIVDVICLVMWWNPLISLLRDNVRFMMELKSDYYAVPDKKHLKHYFEALLLIHDNIKKRAETRAKYEWANPLVDGSTDDLEGRLIALSERDDSRTKRILTNVLYSVFIFAFFVASYAFTIQPATLESGLEVSTREFSYREAGDVFRPEEVFLYDNKDGTFSLYVEGQFVEYIDYTNELTNVLLIRTREAY